MTETRTLSDEFIELALQAAALLEQPKNTPFPVEVQPPQHVLEQIMLEMEGDYTLNSLRYVVYNDADKAEWLQPAGV